MRSNAVLLCFHLPRSAQCGGKTTVKHKRPPTSDGVSGGKHFLKFGKESLLVLLSLRPIPACVSASRGPATWTQTAKGCSQTSPTRTRGVFQTGKGQEEAAACAAPSRPGLHLAASHRTGPCAVKAPESVGPRSGKANHELRY